MAAMTKQYEELITNLKQASTERTTRFNALVEQVEKLTTNQKMIAGQVISAGPDATEQIVSNMDVELIKTGLVDDLKSAGITPETIKEVVSGNPEVAAALKEINAKVSNDLTANIVNTLANINTGIAQLKEAVYSVNGNLTKNESTDIAFRQSMVKQLGKIGRVTQQDALNMNLQDFRNTQATYSAYQMGRQHISNLNAELANLHQTKTVYRDQIAQIKSGIENIMASGNSSPDAQQAIHNQMGAMTNITNELDNLLGKITNKEIEYFDAFGALSGIGSTILGNLQLNDVHPDSAALDFDYVTKALESRLARLNEKRCVS